MRKLLGLTGLLVLVLIVGGCAFSLPGSGGHTQPPGTGDAALEEHVSGLILVRLADDANPDTVAEAVSGTVMSLRNGLARIALRSGTSVSAGLAGLAGRPDVVYAEPVYIYRTPVSGSARKATVRLEDYYRNQWGPGSINADDVWALASAPDPSSIIVAVVDTGIDLDNPEFAGRILTGRNTISGADPGDYGDDEGHGTHIAGIIGAGHDGNEGIKGIAGTVKLLPVKVLDAEGRGMSDDIAAGIEWAADQGADLINLSLGGWGRSQCIQDAIDHALGHGTIVVAAMGNEYRHGASHYPAACEGAIAVGAVKPDGTKADFSSEGPYISIAAPGVDIFSTIWTSGSPSHSFAYWSGTSMAVPHVTGVIALLLAGHPSAAATRIRSILEGTASPGAWTRQLGYGLVDALAAVEGYDGTADVYGGLAVTVTDLGEPVANAEVLVQDGAGNAVAANRTDAGGVARFHYLKGAAGYKIYVTTGAQSGSQTNVTIVAGSVSAATIAL